MGEEKDEEGAFPPQLLVGSGGEVSISVEETNRLRLQLGLKPLATSIPDSAQPTTTAAAVVVAEDPEKIRERISEQRLKRAREELVSGKSLPEILGEDDLDPVAWVERMRKADAAAAAAKRRRLHPTQMENDDNWNNNVMGGRGGGSTARQRRGGLHVVEDEMADSSVAPPPSLPSEEEAVVSSEMLVAHRACDIQHLRSGEELLLTLRDRPLIDAGGDLDDEGDVLENIDLVKDRLRRERDREVRAGVKGPARGHQEDGKGASSSSNVLDHYDEWAVEAKMVKKPKGYDTRDAVKIGRVINQDNNDDDDDTAQPGASLEGYKQETLLTPVGIQRDYLTAEEAAQAALRFKKKKKKVKPKAKPPSALARLEEGEEEEDGEEQQRKSLNPVVKRPPPPVDDAEHSESLELYEQLMRKRSKALLLQQQKQQEREEQSNGATMTDHVVKEDVKPDHVARIVKEVKGEGGAGAASTIAPVKAEEDEEQKVEEASNTKGEKKEETLNSSSSYIELTPTTEFCRSLRASNSTLASKAESRRQALHAATRQHKASRSHRRRSADDEQQQASNPPASAPASGPADDDDVVLTLDATSSGDEGAGVGGEDGEKEAKDPSNEALEQLRSEELLTEGVASALNLLKAKGELGEDAAWRLVRHKKDNVPLHISTKTGDVKIEYRDEFGRVLAPKEAFRYISWAFHGKGPGKKKRETLLKKIETEKKKKAIATNVQMLPTMQALTKQQQTSGQAHLLLSSIPGGSSSST